MKKLLLALVLLTSPAFAQAPPPVPALPDTQRQTNYSITSSTCACAVNFALYGDSTDYQNWVEVWLNGTRVNFNDATFGWTITSPTGPLSTIPRPITDAVLTFTNAQTGTVQIVGARRPRRVSQFSENRGVAARDLNQALTDIVAQNRETWDRTNDVTGRAILGLPGEIITPLPPAASRAGGYLCWDGTGLIPLACSPLNGQGNVVGPNSSTDGHFAFFNGATGRIIRDGGAPAPSATIDTTNAANISSGTLPPQRLPAGIDTNTLNSKTANYTIASTDCGSTIQAGTGSTGLFTVTLPAVAGFSGVCTVNVKNGDTARGKILSGFPADVSTILWPLQSVTVKIINGVWASTHTSGRWRLPANTSFFFDNTNGLDTNDCLAAGAGNACKSPQGLWNLLAKNIDLNGFNPTLQSAAGQTYTTLATDLLLMGPLVDQGAPTAAGTVVVIDGAGSTFLSSSNTGAAAFVTLNNGLTVPVQLQNMTISNGTSTVDGACVGANSPGAYLTIGPGVTFANCSRAIFAATGGIIQVLSSGFTYVANTSVAAVNMIDAELGGNIQASGAATTITITNGASIGFSDATVTSNYLSQVWIPFVTFSGANPTAGKRFDCTMNAIIFTGSGGSATYIPGAAAGTATTGCTYQ